MMRARVVVCGMVLSVACGVVWVTGQTAELAKAPDPIRLIVRADDMGSSHAANVACIQACTAGIARSIEVMVPCPWFNEAVRMLREHPDIDVGVHLTLTSEWGGVKWGPVTQAPSLVDAQGHFYPMTSQREDFPPNTGFLQCGYKLDEVEAELRAQIELARRHLPQLTHITSHMGTPTCTPALRAIVARLAAEYGLLYRIEGVRSAGGFGGSTTTPPQKIAALVAILEALEPGTSLFVDHPGLDTPEMRAIGHTGYEHVAADRAGVTAAFTSREVKDVIRRRGIELVSYGDLKRQAEAHAAQDK